MEKVERIKLKILRAAVQDNIDDAHRKKPKMRPRRKVLFSFWFWTALLVPAIAYLLVPAQGTSTWSDRAPEPAKVKTAPRTASAGEIAETGEFLPAPPRPLNRLALPLAIKKIVIDPGHGGRQHGAISDSGVSEKEITLDISRRLGRLFEKSPFDILMTRQSDETLPLDRRVAFANENRADIFVSIHVNSVEPRDIRPLEIFYAGPSDDPAIVKLAALENRDSGYSMADYRVLLDKAYLDARRHESRLLAQALSSNLYQSLKPVNPELENRGIKMAPFVVLVGTEMPAILVEVSALSNEQEVSLLTSVGYREKIARALYEGIVEYATNLNGLAKKGN